MDSNLDRFKLIEAEATGLSQFLDELSPADLQRPSASYALREGLLSSEQI